MSLQVEEATHDHAAHLARASHVHPPLPPGATWHGMAYSPDTHEYVLLAPPSRQQDEQLQQIAALAARRQNAKELHLDPDDVLLQGHSRISHVGHPTDGSHKRLQHVHHTGRRQQQQSEKQPEGGGVGGTSSATPDGGAGAAALSSGPPHPNMRHHHYSHTAPFMRIRIGADEAATLPDPLQPLDPAAITPPPPGLIVSPETAGAASAPPPAVGEDHALLSQVKIAQIDTLGGEVTITAEDVAGAKRPIVFDEETLQPPDAAAVTVSPPPE